MRFFDNMLTIRLLRTLTGNRRVELFRTFGSHPGSYALSRSSFPLVSRSRSPCPVVSPVWSHALHTTAACRAPSGGDNSFSCFPVPPLESLPEDLQARMKDVQDKSGFLPNVFSTLSYRPDEMRAFLNFYDILMQETGNLTIVDKEMIVVATSGQNRCLYCIVAHGALHRLYSKNPCLADQLAANWKTADLDDRQRAILEFADDVCHCRPISEERFQRLYDVGLTKDDAWDIGAVTSFFALSNRMAFLTNMKPNPEFYLLGRVRKEK